jgi:catechol 2,3-dioxygenase-like lactoylglutathione lyase family enzyme
MPDLGLTHVALTARDLDASIAFYAKYAGMAVVHRRAREGVRSVWLSDHTRPFVIVLVEAAGQQDHPLGPFGHSALPARAGRRSTGYMPRRAVKADRHALRSMPATLSAIPCGLPTPTAIRSSSLLARRSGLPCSRRRKDKPGWFWVSTMEV